MLTIHHNNYVIESFNNFIKIVHNVEIAFGKRLFHFGFF